MMKKSRRVVGSRHGAETDPAIEIAVPFALEAIKVA